MSDNFLVKNLTFLISLTKIAFSCSHVSNHSKIQGKNKKRAVNSISQPFYFEVGMTGLEPATTRPPDVYSTT